MSSLPESVQSQFALLRKSYTQQLLNKIQQIEELWQQRETEWNDRTLATLHRMIHNLAGSGATFGFSSLSDRACTLERFLRSIMEDGERLTQEAESQITTLITVLHEAATKPDPSITSQRLEESLLPHVVPHTSRNNRLVFLVKEDVELAKDLMLQISYFGYNVRIFTNLVELKAAVQTSIPAVIIIDIVSLEGGFAGAEAIAALQREQPMPIPIMFISVRSDLPARLMAVRAGSYAYFTKPIEISALIDKLDALTVHPAPDPYRILIIEDEPTLAAYYSLTLEQAGMVTSVMLDPLHIMQPLVEFRPDLILMDIYMPTCSGLELAAVIRQLEAYVSIPIVYLSTETNVDKQLTAMSLGGDDFLIKPIHPDHLIKAVASRAQRSRILRSFMVRDSLTGLLNHTKTKEQLAIELSRAQRQSTPLTFAMIDIDHFKSVNDSYGHTVGDRVIKSLARLLQQRLRKTDCIGRYGGEEFAVILPCTDAVAARIVLDELRNGFAQIRHQFTGKEFSVTFSCGLATYPDYVDSASLSDAADRALYTAKSLGRNQVVVAEH